jgi:hypothetical protein
VAVADGKAASTAVLADLTKVGNGPSREQHPLARDQARGDAAYEGCSLATEWEDYLGPGTKKCVRAGPIGAQALVDHMMETIPVDDQGNPEPRLLGAVAALRCVVEFVEHATQHAQFSMQFRMHTANVKAESSLLTPGSARDLCASPGRAIELILYQSCGWLIYYSQAHTSPCFCRNSPGLVAVLLQPQAQIDVGCIRVRH